MPAKSGLDGSVRLAGREAGTGGTAATRPRTLTIYPHPRPRRLLPRPDPPSTRPTGLGEKVTHTSTKEGQKYFHDFVIRVGWDQLQLARPRRSQSIYVFY